MEKVLKHILDWFETYLKNRDIMLKKIVKIEKSENRLKVTFRDKVQNFLVFPEISKLPQLPKKNPSLVLLNSEANLRFLVNNWPKLIDIKQISIYFVNPFSETDKKWVIFPHTHHQVSDSKSLELGLRSMFGQVEAITIEEYGGKI